VFVPYLTGFARCFDMLGIRENRMDSLFAEFPPELENLFAHVVAVLKKIYLCCSPAFPLDWNFLDFVAFSLGANEDFGVPEPMARADLSD
jgi:hypothetical protein